MFDQYGGFLVATSVGLVMALATFWAARRAGLQPAQTILFSTLNDTVRALQAQVVALQADLAKEHAARVALEQRVADQEQTIIRLASENTDLKARVSQRRRADG